MLKTWIRRLAGGLAVVMVVVLGLAFLKPDHFSVVRRIQVAAPPQAIYPLLADLHQFGRWSPWEHLDPAMKREFAGPPSGVGAVYGWKGNSDVGEGRMEITGAEPPQRVLMKLDFIEPFASQNRTEYLLSPAPAAGGTPMTEVRWTMEGPMPFVSKLMSVFFSMDAMIGPDFERGLAKLKQEAEGDAQAAQPAPSAASAASAAS